MKENKKELKTIELEIIDDFGNMIGDLSIISFVDDPAIQQNYMLFSKDKYVFAKTDEEKKIVVGPAMRANYKMLRQDADGEYYNSFFSEETVKKCSEIYLKNSNHTQTNLQHSELLTSNEIDGVYIIESWIVEDVKNDKANALGFKELSKGDWYVSWKIDNKEFWDFLKSNKGGFSIEGMFIEKFSEIIDEEKTLEEIKKTVFAEDISDEEKETKIKKLLKI